MKTMKMALVGVASVVLVSGCAAAETGGDKKSDSKSITGADVPKTVTYEVSGTTKASLTYSDGTTKTTQETEAKIPWTKEITPGKQVILFQLMAQNGDQASKSISCSIKVDGKVVDENTSKGQFAIAQCQYTPE